MTTCVMMFVKEPTPGSVKTRLLSHLSPQEAADLYRAFVADSARTLARCNARRKVIAYTPVSGIAAVSDLLRNIAAAEAFEFVPQPEGDLGERMARLFADRFDEGVERVVVVGSDSPSLPSSIIDQAFSLLQKHGLVLGPSTDGGYYLLGQSAPDDRIFRQIDWSTGQVLEQTLRNTVQGFGLLPPWYDVDSPAEAAFLKVHLQAIQLAGGSEGEYSLHVLNQLSLPPPS